LEDLLKWSGSGDEMFWGEERIWIFEEGRRWDEEEMNAEAQKAQKRGDKPQEHNQE
jgi:hypothetical protein